MEDCCGQIFVIQQKGSDGLWHLCQTKMEGHDVEIPMTARRIDLAQWFLKGLIEGNPDIEFRISTYSKLPEVPNAN